MQETYQETLYKIRKRRREFAENRASAETQKIKDQTAQESESPEPDPDYMQLCQAYQKKWDVSLTEAMRQIEKIVPEAKPAYLAKVNSEKEAENAPPRIEKVDGKDFIQMVNFLKLNYGMSTIQAHRHIDKNWPGLRQHYIDQCNRSK